MVRIWYSFRFQKIWKFQTKNQIERKFPGKMFQELGIPQEVDLFFWNYGNSQISDKTDKSSNKALHYCKIDDV